jgi:polyisoprenoid-binding protein YceI
MIRRLSLALALAAAATPALAATYTLDPMHTQVVFGWNHFGFSNPSGQFGDVRGTLQFDPAAPTRGSVDVTVALASVNTNVPKLDEHLATADFFDASKYPTATFKSTRVEPGSDASHLKVTGDLTLHGQTHPIVLDVTINKVGEHPMRKTPAAGFDATTTIRRSEFGITKYVPAVSDDIRVHITSEAFEEKAPAAAPKG